MIAIAVVLAACGDDGGTPVDAAVDALLLGPVQCRTIDDCMPLTGGCFQSRGGGVCVGCTVGQAGCPAGTQCVSGGTSGQTECARPCVSDADCNLAMACVTTGALAGFCQPRACGDGLAACPYPYTFCRETLAPLFECSRPRCAGGCPPPLVCPTGGAFCLEP